MIPPTGIPALDWFLALLVSWGYLIVIFFTVFENTFVVGSFTPGETVVIAAAFIASQGELSLALVWGSSMFGTLLGSNAGYILGRHAGMEGVRAFADRAAHSRWGRVLRIHPGVVDEVHDHFHEQGSKTVFISRFAIGAKNFVPAIAGAVKMPFYWFELYTVLGAIAYTTIMCAIGWLVGYEFEAALRIASSIGWVGLAVLALFIFAVVFGRKKHKARVAERMRSSDSLPPDAR